MLQTSKEAILTYYKPLSSAFIALTLSELSASLGRIKETWSEFFIPVSLQRALSSLHITILAIATPPRGGRGVGFGGGSRSMGLRFGGGGGEYGYVQARQSTL